jgi:lysyl-tRNA synthetase class 1
MITLVQIGKTAGLDKAGKERAKRVSNWLEKYAGDDMKFEVQDKVKVKLNVKEKKALIELREVLGKKKYKEDELFNEFYKICEGVGISNKDFFNVAYRVIIGKERGPRLALLILNVGQEKIVKLLGMVK